MDITGGTYKGYTYQIKDQLGQYFTAYVQDSGHSLDWLEKNLIVHGGISYYGMGMFGWDYAHPGDYHTIGRVVAPGHKWTCEEIEEEIKNVIDQMEAIK